MPPTPEFQYEGLVEISDQAARAALAKKTKLRRPVDQAYVDRPDPRPAALASRNIACRFALSHRPFISRKKKNRIVTDNWYCVSATREQPHGALKRLQCGCTRG